MIWIWVALACIITILLLLNKKIPWHHYIWMLLPIDMYGIAISGITLKPYMLFSVILLIRVLSSIKNKSEIRFNARVIIISLMFFSLFFLLDIFNGAGFEAFKQHFMLIMVVLCALIYVSMLTGENDLPQISQVLIATALGYGIVFFIVLQMNALGNNYGSLALSTFERSSEGIILKFTDITEGRLRGFFIDPNVVVTGFIVAIAIALYSLSNEKSLKNKIRYILTIGICTIDLYYTESRTALIIFIIIVLFSTYLHLKDSGFKKRFIFNIVLILFGVFILIINSPGISPKINFEFFGQLFAQYQSRSSLNDEYGRMTIWKNALNILIDNNILLGIGQGQITDFISRDCHNTWLEWIVGNGILVGGLIVSLFFCVPIYFYLQCRKIKEFKNEYYLISLGMLFGFIGIIISLFTVSNITNSHLIFMTILLTTISKRSLFQSMNRVVKEY